MALFHTILLEYGSIKKVIWLYFIQFCWNMAVFHTILLEYGSISYNSTGIWFHFIRLSWNMAPFHTILLEYGSVSNSSTEIWLYFNQIYWYLATYGQHNTFLVRLDNLKFRYSDSVHTIMSTPFVPCKLSFFTVLQRLLQKFAKHFAKLCENQCCGSGSKGSASFCRLRIYKIFHGSGCPSPYLLQSHMALFHTILLEYCSISYN